MNSKNGQKPKFARREEKWLKVWGKQGFRGGVDFDKKRKKRYILVEFPYPSGEGLHIGHAFTMTGADIYARKQRMSGGNVLFPMGWDAFGLPTENYALRTGISPQKATKDNTDNFRRQMKRMAFSFDWEREINTTDPDYYRWTQWIFIQLFKAGLAYKKEMPINWCPACRIGLANEEVVDGGCERCGAPVGKKNLSQWIVKITAYAEKLIDGLNSPETDFIEKVRSAQINWIGKKKGARIKFKIKSEKLKIKELAVFTTRPDTIWGATFMAVSPEHPLVEEVLKLGGRLSISAEEIKAIKNYVKKAKGKSDLERAELQKEKTGVFSGLWAVNPVNDKKIPIWIADFVLSGYGAGAVMAVPAHDERDRQFAKKYRLPIRPVIRPEGKWDFAEGAYTEVEKGRMVNSGPLNGLAPKAAIKKAVKILEEKGAGRPAVSYHLRDWIFSRQHYWGEPIPMVYCPACAKKGITWRDAGEIKSSKLKVSEKLRKESVGWFPVPEEQLPIKLPKVKKYQPTKTGESPLAAVKGWAETSCPHCGASAKRETDTMPNWAGSDWYYLAYLFRDKLKIKNWQKGKNIFAENKDVLRYWLPVDIYIGGDEHNTLHMLYSRFIYRFLHDLGVAPREYPEPYCRRLSHGVILGPDGKRMSKSRGNVVVPDAIWKKYGVDALRTYLAFMGPFTGTIVWNEKALKGVGRFLEKFARLVESLRKEDRGEDLEEAGGDLGRLVEKVSRDIDRFHFNTAVAAMMEFLNQLKEKKKKPAVGEGRILVRLVAPFAPYLAEEWWEGLGGEGSVHAAVWPKAAEGRPAGGEAPVAVQVDGRLRGVIKVPSSKFQVPSYIEKKAREEAKVAGQLRGRKVARVVFVPGRLINFVTEGGGKNEP